MIGHEVGWVRARRSNKTRTLLEKAATKRMGRRCRVRWHLAEAADMSNRLSQKTSETFVPITAERDPKSDSASRKRRATRLRGSK